MSSTNAWAKDAVRFEEYTQGEKSDKKRVSTGMVQLLCQLAEANGSLYVEQRLKADRNASRDGSYPYIRGASSRDHEARPVRVTAAGHEALELTADYAAAQPATAVQMPCASRALVYFLETETPLRAQAVFTIPPAPLSLILT